MTKYLLMLTFLITGSGADAQNFQWARQFSLNSSSQDGFPNWNGHLSIDGNGSIYSIIQFSEPADMDPGTGSFILDPANGKFAIVSLNSSGSFSWAVQFAVNAMSLTSDESGNVFAAGYFSGTVDFDPGSGVQNLVSSGYDNGYFLKLNGNGDLQWAKQIGGPGGDYIGKIALLNGNLLLTGRFGYTGSINLTPSADFNPDPAIEYNLSAIEGADGFLASYSQLTGEFIWVRQAGRPGQNSLDQLCVDQAGNIFVTGGLNSSYSLEKLNADGELIWGVTINNNSGYQIFNIKAGTNGIYVSGNYSGTIDFNPETAISNLTASTIQDPYFLKLNHLGELVWLKTMKTNGTAVSIDYDEAGNVYVAGNYRSSSPVDFDPGPGKFSLYSKSNICFFLQKLSSTGVFQWVRQIGSEKNSSVFAHDIIVTDQGNIFTTIDFSGTVDFDPFDGKYVLQNGGSVVHKISQPAGSFRNPGNLITKNAVNVFPNPASNQLTVSFSEPQKNAIIMFFDISGRELFRRKISGISNREEIQLIDYPAGIYIFTILSNTMHVQKMIEITR